MKILSLLVAVILLNSRVDGSCPEGYCRHAGACYLVVDLKVSWIDARSYCSTLGGSLLVITSSTQQTAAEGALRRSKGIVQPGSFWLDITDLLNPKEWRSMSSRASLSFTNWSTKVADGSVNDTNVGNCVYMSESTDYTWRPGPCDRRRNFVCYHSGLRRYYRYSSDENDLEC